MYFSSIKKPVGFILVSLIQLFLDEVEGEKKSVLPEECIVLLFITTLAGDIRRAEARTAAVDDTAWDND